MRRRAAVSLLLSVTALVTMAVAVLAATSWGRVDGPTYSLAQVEAGLARHPEQWLGKSVRLHALVFALPLPCPRNSTALCGTADLLLDDLNGVSRSTTGSALQRAAGSPMLVRLESNQLLDGVRRIPGLGRLLPEPQSLAGGAFRVTVEQAAPSFLCLKQPCYQAILPDAGPGEVAGRSRGTGAAPYQQGMAGFVSGPAPSLSR